MSVIHAKLYQYVHVYKYIYARFVNYSNLNIAENIVSIVFLFVWINRCYFFIIVDDRD